MDGNVVIDTYQPALKDVLLNEFEIQESQKEKELVYNFTNIHYLELKKWPIFNLLSLDFIKQIYTVLIIDENGAIIATRDGFVHALGNNNNGKLGIVNIRNILQPIKIDTFYKETIDKFVCCLELGRTALLASGKAYFWGTNEVLSSDTLYTFFQITELKDNYIKDMVCGMQHFLFLTISGEVYFWGVESWKINLKDIVRDVHNDEQDSTKDDTTNTDLFYMINFNRNKVVFIACGAHFNVAITDEDQVYSWGSNIYGQLGIDEVPCVNRLKPLNSIYKSTPHEITTLSKKNIVKIVCGNAHSLALTKKGQLYVWGGNQYKQSGTIKHDVKLLCCPVMLEMEVKILDIAANYLHHTSVALGSNECIYIWGYWNNEEISTPTITQFLNMYDIFLHNVPYMIYNIMPVNKYERKCDTLKILGCIENAFNSNEKTDLVIQVEEQSIHVHKAILIIRSTYFRYMFQHDWADKNISVIKHKQFSYCVYNAYLEYLYTNRFVLRVEEMLELLVLANAYCEPRLEYFCHQYIKSGIHALNVLCVYESAIQHKFKDLEEYSFKFILRHTTDVISSAHFKNLNREIRVDLICKLIKEGALKT